MAGRRDRAAEAMGPEGRALCAESFPILAAMTRRAIAAAREIETTEPRLEHQRHARWLAQIARTVREVARLDLPPPAEPADSNASGEDQMGDTRSDDVHGGFDGHFDGAFDGDFEKAQRRRAGLEARLHGLIDQQSRRTEAGGERLGEGAVGRRAGARGGPAVGPEYASAAA